MGIRVSGAKCWRRAVLWVMLALPLSVAADDFALQDLQGKVHRLADYRGKWVLVNFWATWCPPCLIEIPELISLHEAHKERDLVVIGVAMSSGSARVVGEFAKKRGINYPVVMGDGKIEAQIGRVDVLPTTYLYAPDGKLVSRQAGDVTRESVETYIKNKKLN